MSSGSASTSRRRTYAGFLGRWLKDVEVRALAAASADMLPFLAIGSTGRIVGRAGIRTLLDLATTPVDRARSWPWIGPLRLSRIRHDLEAWIRRVPPRPVGDLLAAPLLGRNLNATEAARLRRCTLGRLMDPWHVKLRGALQRAGLRTALDVARQSVGRIRRFAAAGSRTLVSLAGAIEVAVAVVSDGPEEAPLLGRRISPREQSTLAEMPVASAVSECRALRALRKLHAGTLLAAARLPPHLIRAVPKCGRGTIRAIRSTVEAVLADRRRPSGRGGDLRALLGDLLSALPPPFGVVLTRRYGLDGSGADTLEAIGRRLRFTRERVRQLLIEANRRMGLWPARPRIERLLEGFRREVRHVLSSRLGGIGNTGEIEAALYEGGRRSARLASLRQFLDAAGLTNGPVTTESLTPAGAGVWAIDRPSADTHRRVVAGVEHVLGGRCIPLGRLIRELRRQVPASGSFVRRSLEAHPRFRIDWNGRIRSRQCILPSRKFSNIAKQALVALSRPATPRDVARKVSRLFPRLGGVSPYALGATLRESRRHFIRLRPGVFSLRPAEPEARPTALSFLMGELRRAGGPVPVASLLSKGKTLHGFSPGALCVRMIGRPDIFVRTRRGVYRLDARWHG